MTVGELEDLAMVPHARMPEEIDQQEQVLFQKFRYLHASYRIGSISREQAAIDKKRFLVDHEKNSKREAFRSRQSEHTVAMWNDISQYSTDYRKERTLENADRLLHAIEGKVDQWSMREDG